MADYLTRKFNFFLNNCDNAEDYTVMERNGDLLITRKANQIHHEFYGYQEYASEFKPLLADPYTPTVSVNDGYETDHTVVYEVADIQPSLESQYSLLDEIVVDDPRDHNLPPSVVVRKKPRKSKGNWGKKQQREFLDQKVAKSKRRDGTYTCWYCQKSINSANGLKIHFRKVHILSWNDHKPPSSSHETGNDNQASQSNVDDIKLTVAETRALTVALEQSRIATDASIYWECRVCQERTNKRKLMRDHYLTEHLNLLREARRTIRNRSNST